MLPRGAMDGPWGRQDCFAGQDAGPDHCLRETRLRAILV